MSGKGSVSTLSRLFLGVTAAAVHEGGPKPKSDAVFLFLVLWISFSAHLAFFRLIPRDNSEQDEPNPLLNIKLNMLNLWVCSFPLFTLKQTMRCRSPGVRRHKENFTLVMSPLSVLSPFVFSGVHTNSHNTFWNIFWISSLVWSFFPSSCII